MQSGISNYFCRADQMVFGRLAIDLIPKPLRGAIRGGGEGSVASLRQQLH